MKKEDIIKSLKNLLSNRYLFVVLSLLILLTITYLIVVGLSIHSSERQLISHYSAFGLTHFYSDQWTYMLSFVFFGLIVSVFHTVISIKMLEIKGQSIAVMYAWFGIAILILGWVEALKVIDLRTLF